METSGLEPEITICKIDVLPIKPCPLFSIFYICDKKNNTKHTSQNDNNTKMYMTGIYIYIHIVSEKRLERSRLKSVKLKLTLSTNFSTRTNIIKCILRQK